MRPIGIRELKKWDRVKIVLYDNEEWREEVATCDGMDGMYQKLILQDWRMANITGYVKKEWDYYVFTSKE